MVDNFEAVWESYFGGRDSCSSAFLFVPLLAFALEGAREVATDLGSSFFGLEDETGAVGG